MGKIMGTKSSLSITYKIINAFTLQLDVAVVITVYISAHHLMYMCIAQHTMHAYVTGIFCEKNVHTTLTSYLHSHIGEQYM